MRGMTIMAGMSGRPGGESEMPHEDLHRSILNGGGKQYRRRKKFQGATWTPDTESALAEDGPWCSECRQRHGYMSKLLLVKYEKRQGAWHVLWICKKSNNVIKDQGIVSGGRKDGV